MHRNSHGMGIGLHGMRAATCLLLVLTSGFAGCSEDGPSAADTDDSVAIAEQFAATEETGVVLGVVVDEAIRPIPNVDVTLATDPPMATTTNEAGEFGFDGIEGGVYIVEAHRTGYIPAVATVEVRVGLDRPPVVKLRMLVDADSLPYVQVLQFDGFLQCGTNNVAICGIGPFVGTLACTQLGACVGNITNDEFIAFHEIDGPPDWVQLEMVWESTQDISEELSALQSYGTREEFNQGFISGTLNSTTGPSPIYVTVNKTRAQNASVALGTENQLVPRTFSASIPETRQCVPTPLFTQCAAFGFAIEQEFTFFTHVFYNYTPTPGWRFTEQNEPPPP